MEDFVSNNENDIDYQEQDLEYNYLLIIKKLNNYLYINHSLIFCVNAIYTKLNL